MRLSGFTNTDMGPSIPSCSSNCIHRSTIAIINSTMKCITCENIGCSTLETTISREAHLEENYTIQSDFIFLEHWQVSENQKIFILCSTNYAQLFWVASNLSMGKITWWATCRAYCYWMKNHLWIFRILSFILLSR